MRAAWSGHVHEGWRIHGHQINVGVDVWDHRPVGDDTLVEEYVRLHP